MQKIHPVWVRLELFIQSKSEGSQRKYRFVLKRWCEYIRAGEGTAKGAKRFIHSSEIEAVSFSVHLRETRGNRRRGHSELLGLSNATIAQNLRILKRFYRCCVEAGLGNQNPFSTPLLVIPDPLLMRKRPTELIPYKAVPDLINAPDSSNHRGLRDKTIMGLLFGCGLRRSEVVRLNLHDVQVTPSGTIFLELRGTKSGRDQAMAIPPWAVETLVEWVTFRHRSGAGPEDPLFTAYHGRAGLCATPYRISPSGLYAMFKGYCEELGLVDKSPHSARATAINKLLDDGFDYAKVKEFSRHQSIEMVEYYDQRTPSLDRSVVRKLFY